MSSSRKREEPALKTFRDMRQSDQSMISASCLSEGENHLPFNIQQIPKQSSYFKEKEKSHKPTTKKIYIETNDGVDDDLVESDPLNGENVEMIEEYDDTDELVTSNYEHGFKETC